MLKKFLARLLRDYAVKWIEPEEVFEIEGAKVKHKGEYLSPERVNKLADDADRIRKSYLWRTLSKEIKHAAYLHWLKTGEDLSSRMLLRADEIIQKRMDKLAKLKGKLPDKK